MKGYDIHNHKRRLQLAIENVQKSGNISKKNKKAILNIPDCRFAEDLSIQRVEHYARILKETAELFRKDFWNATKESVIGFVGKIESRRLSVWTKHDCRAALRKSFKCARAIPRMEAS